MTIPLVFRIGIALGLGLLVGLQRQRVTSGVAGIRTFPLVALLGVLCGALAPWFGGWLVGAGLISLAAYAVSANLGQDESPGEIGLTTEVAVLVMFVVGAALSTDYVVEAAVAGGIMTLLLHWKAPLHAFAARIGSRDFGALMQLALIVLIILPILPNEAFGPYRVLNPFQIWLMVVLIVGLSMAGYIAFKMFGQKRGALAAGLLGGLISSTATTASYAQRSARSPDRSPAAALVIALASTVVFARVLIEIAVVAPEIFMSTAPPLAAMMVVMVLVSAGLYRAGVKDATAEVRDEDPPSDLKSAMLFGLLYGAILLAVAWAEDRLGARGLFAVAALSGLTDVDAITLSTAQLMRGADGLDPAVGWRVILVGALANLLFKGGIVAATGHRALRSRIGFAFLIAIGGGIGVLWLWPS